MSVNSSRWTRQLKVVIDVVYSSDEPLGADSVYEQARKRLPNISLGTVYRNLNKLVKEGLVSETQAGSMQVFIKHPFSNATFECELCGKLECVPFEIKLSDMEKQAGQQVNRWNLRMTGVCKECASKCT